MADIIEDAEVKDLALKLIQKYSSYFKHVDSVKMLFVREISNSQRPDSGSLIWVYPPFNLLNPDIFYILQINWKSNWDQISQAQKVALVMHQLLHIPEDFQSNPMKHSVSDFAILVDNLGSNWQTNDRIPNLIDMDEPIIDIPSDSEV